MENYTDFNNVQQPHLELTDFGQNTHFPHIDFPSLPNTDTLQDLNSFPTDTHQTIYNSTFSGGVSFSKQPVDQQNVTYNSHSNQYPNNNWSNQGHVKYAPNNNDDLFSCPDNSQDHSIGEQSSFGTYPGYNMATETPAIAVPIESGSTAGYRSELRCSVPKYSQDREFPSESALRKHKATHSKSYICQVPNCKHTHFGNKGGLDRHNREVHGSQAHFCPITSCKRHVRGFPRKYNLSEHQKRCHSSQSPNLALPSIIKQNHTNDSMKGQQESYNRCCDTAEIPPREDPGDVEGDRQAKLEEYCNWGLAQVESDRWRRALQIANQVAVDQFLELNTILQHPMVVVELMEKNGVAPGIALQFVSNIKRFQQEERRS
ncbi:uncharacterized protein PAC_01959 [Phialocephala subalpina]|uniref:C2H2-type domain-containing protein n=1 Tax=Phialocephala subalpina TaxID=576137 RepID=A0A1L7WH30_9HELO|nr:uncharacterized protein PAC_01959 [Phialocephala subalpina]